MRLSKAQREMLERACNDPNLKAPAGHRADRTAQKLAELGLGTRAFYGGPVFYINVAGIKYLADNP